MDNYRKMTIRELRPVLVELELPVSGTKAVLLQRIQNCLEEKAALKSHMDRNGKLARAARKTNSKATTATINRKSVRSKRRTRTPTPPSTPKQPPPTLPGDESPSLFVPHEIPGRPQATALNEVKQTRDIADMEYRHAKETIEEHTHQIAERKSAISQLQKEIIEHEKAVEIEESARRKAQRHTEKKRLALQKAESAVRSAQELAEKENKEMRGL